MLRRLLVVPALVLVGALAAGGCASNVSPAVSINGVKISDRQLMDEVGEWARNSRAVDQTRLAEQPAGTFPQDLVGAIIRQRIQLELIHAQFEHLGLRVTGDARTQALAALTGGDPQAGQQLVAEFSKGYRDDIVEQVAEFVAVEGEMGADFDAWQSKAYDEADIEVSPKYGTWDKTTGEIAPPKGPQQPTSDTALLGG